MTAQQEKWILKYIIARATMMWSWWPPRKQCKQAAYKGRDASGNHQWQCAECRLNATTVQIDHKNPKGKAPQNLEELPAYLRAYFCRIENLQCLCTACHKIKTKADVKQIRGLKKV